MIGRPSKTSHSSHRRGHPPRCETRKDSPEEMLRVAEEVDFAVMEEHRARGEEIVQDPATAELRRLHGVRHRADRAPGAPEEDGEDED